MTRSDIIKRIAAKKPSLFTSDIEKIVGAINRAIADNLLSGGRVELRSFGVFSQKRLSAKVASSPRGGKISLPDRTSVKFKPGKSLSAKVNK
ncbi:MAG: integration host factor subunit beta [Rickettsiales bacterium]|jgi:integration host factor subunit beta|nr:integration host factor subunit beta [Rickettsiales bacterium]